MKVVFILSSLLLQQVSLPRGCRTRSSTPWCAPQQPRAVWRWSVPATHPPPCSTFVARVSAKCCPAAQTYLVLWSCPQACAPTSTHSWAGFSPSASAPKSQMNSTGTCLRTSMRRWACLPAPAPASAPAPSRAPYPPWVPAPPRAPAPVRFPTRSHTSAPVRHQLRLNPALVIVPQLLPAATMIAAALSRRITNAKDAAGHDLEIKNVFVSIQHTANLPLPSVSPVGNHGKKSNLVF